MVLALPFLPIDSWEDHVKVRKAVHEHDQVKKEMAKWGALIYSTSYLPMYELMGRGNPPRTIADWKAMNIRGRRRDWGSSRQDGCNSNKHDCD